MEKLTNAELVKLVAQARDIKAIQAARLLLDWHNEWIELDKQSEASCN